jgi:ABC-type lipoprotein export system ATPase subunit
VERTSIDQLTDVGQAAGVAAVRPTSQASFGGDAVIACDSLVRIYSTAGIEVQALQGLDLLIEPGELTALVGASGSGKSTLLNILAGLDTPTAGRARVAGHDLLAMSTRERLDYRRESVGFLWQQTSRNLFSHLTAAENVALPMRLAARGRKARKQRTTELLDTLGVGYCRDRMPAEMSGGEQQRVAIGVALANEPAVLLADEPTGELDTGTGEEVFAAMRTANTDLGVTILVVTHDQQVSEQVRRTIAIRDGRISTEVLRHTQTDAEGQEADVAQEYAVLDRAGRLQIPRDFIETLDMRDRVLLALESDHVGVWPDAAVRNGGPGVRHRAHGRHERAYEGSASPDPATPPSASPDPATPPSASPDPATPPNHQQDA